MSYAPQPRLYLSNGETNTYEDLSEQEKRSLDAITEAITIPSFRESHVIILKERAREGDLDAQQALVLLEIEW